MPFKASKRFIAGAACPKCAALDTVVTYRQDGKEYRECVACGFMDEMRTNAPPRELITRVNSTEERKQIETQVLSLTPNSNRSKH